MVGRCALILAMGVLTASQIHAADACDDLSTSLRRCELIVGSLRPDKAGQQRVYASDGSEFTGGQALWMKGQLREISKDCSQGNLADASRRLGEVQELLNRHHRDG